MTKYIIQFNENYIPDAGVFNTQPSETIQGQAKTVEEIVTRFATGMPLGVDDNEGQFFDDNLVVDVKKLDLTQRQDLAIAARERAFEIRRKLELADAERKKQQFLKSIENEYRQQQQQQAASTSIIQQQQLLSDANNK